MIGVLVLPWQVSPRRSQYWAPSLISDQLLDIVISVMWSVYAGRGYARHLYYILPSQLPDIIKLNTISRSLCMFSISIGKISVAFLIERFTGPSNWRKWLLRSISISVFISAVITLTFFYAQCQPARAVWDKYLLKEGNAHCWNPIPVNNWNLVIASRSSAINNVKGSGTDKSIRLLGFPGLCSCRHTNGYCMEAANGLEEEDHAQLSARHGHLVSSVS